MRGQSERGQDEEAAGGGGEGARQVGGAYVERLGGARGAGWGWGGTGASSGKGRRAGGRPRSGRAGGQRSAPLRLAATECPRPGHRQPQGMIWRVPGPAPAPSAGRGRGRGNHRLGEGGGRRRELMAPTGYPETGPAAASPHAALSNSSGCDRDGSRERGEGEALKETDDAAGSGAAEDKRAEAGLLSSGAPWPAGVGALGPQMGLSPFPTSSLQMPAISSSAKASQYLFLSCLGVPA